MLGLVRKTNIYWPSFIYWLDMEPSHPSLTIQTRGIIFREVKSLPEMPQLVEFAELSSEPLFSKEKYFSL